MIKLKPNLLEKDGKIEFAVIPYEDFLLVQEELEDFEDLKLLRDAKESEGNAPSVDINDVKKELGIF